MEELDQASVEKESLQGETEIYLLQTCLEETDARPRHVVEEKIKNELLADGVKNFKREIAERESTWKEGKGLKVNNTTIKENGKAIQSYVSGSPTIAGELKALEDQNKSLKEEVKVLTPKKQPKNLKIIYYK